MFSQGHISDAGALNTYRSGFSTKHANIEAAFPDFQDSVYVSNVMKQIKKASGLANTGIALGSIANLTLLLDMGVMSGELYGWQGLVGIVGLSTGITRWGISLAAPHQIWSVDNLLRQSGQTIWDEQQIEHSLHHIRIALNASRAVPVLGIFGLGFVAGGIILIGYDIDAGPALWCAGWVCAFSGLITSVVTSTNLSRAKKILETGSGSVNIGMNSQGIGLCYSWH